MASEDQHDEPPPITITTSLEPEVSEANTQNTSPTSHRSDTQDTVRVLSTPSMRHMRQGSVVNSLPAPYLNKMPSLIALVDQSAEQGLRSRRGSLSRLKFHDAQSVSALDENFEIPDPVDRRSSEEVDLYTLALEAQDQLTALVNENDTTNRENLRLTVQLEDMVARVAELEDAMDVTHQGEDELARSHSQLQRSLMEKEERVERLQAELEHVRNDKAEADALLTLSMTSADMAERARQKASHNRDISQSGFVNDNKARQAVLHQERAQQLAQELDDMRRKYRGLEKEYEMERDNVSNLVEQVETRDEEIKILQEDADDKSEFYRDKQMDYIEIEEENADLQDRLRSLTSEKTHVESKEEELRQQIVDQEVIIEDLKIAQDDILRVIEQQQTDKITEDDHLFSLLLDLRQQTVRPQSYTQFSDEFVNELQMEKVEPSLTDNMYFMMGGPDQSMLPSVRVLHLERAESSMMGPEVSQRDDEKAAEQEAVLRELMNSSNSVPKPAVKKVRKMEVQKASAEQEFFFLTCLCVKMNLAEEYSDKPAILEEDVIGLWNMIQKEAVTMNKFAVWVEAHLRGKHELPQLYRGTTFQMPALRLPKLQMEKINEARLKAASRLSVVTRKAKSLAERVRTPSNNSPVIAEDELEGDDAGNRLVKPGYNPVVSGSEMDRNETMDGRMPEGEQNQEPPPATCANCVVM